MVATHDLSPLLITSTPALAAALRTLATDRFVRPIWPEERRNALVPMYQVQHGDMTAEASAVAHVVVNVADRLRRLGDAYGEWQVFDAPAYFDLSLEQSAQLVKLSERVSTVHIRFCTDLLLPSFQQAATFWQTRFASAYQQMRQDPLVGMTAYQLAQPAMLAHWQQLGVVIQTARALLAEDIGFLATNAAHEERMRWRQWWSSPAAGGLDPQLAPPLADVPTLTLSFEFPLPSHRQPERLRRLRANRERRRSRPTDMSRLR